MSNRIRHYLKDEVEQLLPLLHDTYRLIGHYQKNRHARHEAMLQEQLCMLGEYPQLFKEVELAIDVWRRIYHDEVEKQYTRIFDR